MEIEDYLTIFGFIVFVIGLGVLLYGIATLNWSSIAGGAVALFSGLGLIWIEKKK
jgi:membrane protein YdbS with pleckstrin-like domain